MKSRVKNRILNIFLALSVAFLAITATAPMPKAETYNGYCGDYAEWYFDDSTGELTLSGSGAVDYICYGEKFLEYKDSIKSIYIDYGIDDISNLDLYSFSALTRITVSADNDNYYSDSDGALYTKDKTTLICFPQASELQSYDVPGGVEIIGECAFWGCNNLVCVELPYSVRRIEGDAFWSFGPSTTAPCGIEIPSTVDAIADTAFEYASNTNIYYTGSESDWENIDIFKHYSFGEDSTLDLTNVTVYYNSYMDAESMVKAVNDELNPPQDSSASEELAGLIVLNLLIGGVLFAIGYNIVRNYKEDNAK